MRNVGVLTESVQFSGGGEERRRKERTGELGTGGEKGKSTKSFGKCQLVVCN